ncbi:fatty acyl-CoA reductase wat-like [Euwallacea similis]|uniref:fatty acyl-CoA reductase wat-like n=1 Tax=Euwallacea similis TaxID=1736056 RepID=UPI00344E40C3
MTTSNSKTISIIGAIGLIGKTLIETLLRSCPDLKLIYMLARSKKGESLQDRISRVFDDPEATSTAENTDEHLLNVLTLKYIRKSFPDSYTYTKHLGEHFLEVLGEPFKGWVDNFYGLIGISVGVDTSVTRILYADPDNEIEFIPVDTVIQEETLVPPDRYNHMLVQTLFVHFVLFQMLASVVLDSVLKIFGYKPL